MEIRWQSLSIPLLALILIAAASGSSAFGQRGTSPVSVGFPAHAPAASDNARSLPPVPPPPSAGTQRPVILLTGYRHPTNEMIRHFASDPALNTNWLGSDWEGRGYDIQAYFPEFANPNCGNCGKGQG